MARHINKAQHMAALEVDIGKSRLDGQATLLFFRQAVGIDPGERLDQQRLAVIHVAGGGDDHGTSSPAR